MAEKKTKINDEPTNSTTEEFFRIRPRKQGWLIERLNVCGDRIIKRWDVGGDGDSWDVLDNVSHKMARMVVASAVRR